MQQYTIIIKWEREMLGGSGYGVTDITPKMSKEDADQLFRDLGIECPARFEKTKYDHLIGTYCAGDEGNSTDVFHGHVSLDEIPWEHIRQTEDEPKPKNKEELKKYFDDMYGEGEWELTHSWSKWKKNGESTYLASANRSEKHAFPTTHLTWGI